MLLIRDEVVALDAAPEKANGQRGAEHRNETLDQPLVELLRPMRGHPAEAVAACLHCG